MVQKDRGSGVPKSAYTDFSFPESAFEIPPIPLVLILDVRTRFQQSLKHEVLDQVGCC
jgi:hypothetical protein